MLSRGNVNEICTFIFIIFIEIHTYVRWYTISILCYVINSVNYIMYTQKIEIIKWMILFLDDILMMYASYDYGACVCMFMCAACVYLTYELFDITYSDLS